MMLSVGDDHLFIVRFNILVEVPPANSSPQWDDDAIEHLSMQQVW